MVVLNIGWKIFLCIILIGCGKSEKPATAILSSLDEAGEPKVASRINQHMANVVGEIPLPKGYRRIRVSRSSFGEYLRKIKVKTDDHIVNLYNGAEKSYQGAQYCILDIDVGSRDLQQCADAVMRIRAEYFYQKKAYDSISFNFTNGDKVNYSKYAAGYRANIQGNKVSWSLSAGPDFSYKNFRNYLNLIYTYAGSYSLSKQLSSKTFSDGVRPGDVIIQGGFPGHAVLVMDVAIHEASGEIIFLLSQSYMPAQEIHILKNPTQVTISPWYSSNFGSQLITPEWTFDRTDLKSW